MKPHLAARLNSATVHLGRALRKEFSPGQLAAEHRSALAVVHFGGPIRMGTLAAAERVGAPAMTKTVAILEREGFVTRERDPMDDRAVVIRATRKGSTMVRRGRDQRVRRIERGLRALAPYARGRVAAAVGDLEALIEVLERASRQRGAAAIPLRK